jgi:hypothetical protein
MRLPQVGDLVYYFNNIGQRIEDDSLGIVVAHEINGSPWPVQVVWLAGRHGYDAGEQLHYSLKNLRIVNESR